jgi:hypothetical protein
MTEANTEVVVVDCPHCKQELDLKVLVQLLPIEVLNSERARRNGLKPRVRRAGPGRPRGVARCPSCGDSYGLDQLRQHLLPCLIGKLNRFKEVAQPIQVKPIDPTEHKEFRIDEVRDESVVLYKLSNGQYVEVPLRAIREVTPSVSGEPVLISLRGALRWRADIERWRFSTE